MWDTVECCNGLWEDLNILSAFIVPLQFLEEVMSTIKKDLSYLEAEPIRASEVNLSEDTIEKMRGDDDEALLQSDLVAEVTEWMMLIGAKCQ